MKLQNKQGFTLIELLVVVFIIGILAAVALPQYQKAVDKSTAVQLLVLGKAIKEAQEVHYLNQGDYATSLEDLDIDVPEEIKRVISFVTCTPSTSGAVDVRNLKIPSRPFVRFRYDHQCPERVTLGTHRTCFANSAYKRANQFCAGLTGAAVKTECSELCGYNF